MNGFWLAFLGAASGIVTFGGGTGIFLAAWLRRQMAELAELRSEVHGEIKRRLGLVEEFAAKHAGLETEMRQVNGWLKKIDMKLDTYTHETSEQRAQIVSNERWIGHIDRAHNDHVRDREVHSRG